MNTEPMVAAPAKTLKSVLEATGAQVARKYAAVVEIHVPSPAAAGSPFKRPRFWHSVHRNNLTRMMAKAGWDAARYRLHRNGEGATLVFHSWDIEASPGEVPEKVQEYIQTHFGRTGWDWAKGVMGGLGPILTAIGAAFPGAGPALTIIGQVAGIGAKTIDVLDGED